MMFHVELYPFQLVEGIDRRFYTGRERQAGEGLKIEQTGIFPPHGIVQLHPETCLNMGKTLGINIRSYRLPNTGQLTGRINTSLVGEAKFVPQRTLRCHDMTWFHGR